MLQPTHVIRLYGGSFAQVPTTEDSAYASFGLSKKWVGLDKLFRPPTPATTTPTTATTTASEPVDPADASDTGTVPSRKRPRVDIGPLADALFTLSEHIPDASNSVDVRSELMSELYTRMQSLAG